MNPLSGKKGYLWVPAPLPLWQVWGCREAIETLKGTTLKALTPLCAQVSALTPWVGLLLGKDGAALGQGAEDVGRG